MGSVKVKFQKCVGLWLFSSSFLQSYCPLPLLQFTLLSLCTRHLYKANVLSKVFELTGESSSSSSRGATLKRNEVVLQRVELGPKSSDQKVSANFQRGGKGGRVITLSSTFSTCEKKPNFST